MSTRMLPAALAAGAAGAALLAPSVASAQQAAQAPAPRLGFFGGFGLHAGNLSCEGNNCPDFREAGGFDGLVGYGFSDRLAGVFDLWVMGSTEDNLTIVQTIATFGVRYWVAPIIWIQGGLGSASATFRYDSIIDLEARTDTVPALMLGGGLEVLRGKRFAMDVQLRVGFGFYDEDNDGDGDADTTGRSAGVGVGFTWF